MKIWNMIIKKTCSIYASDLHFITMTLPYINRELENEVQVITILEKSATKNIEKLINNMNLNKETKERILNINWSNTRGTAFKKVISQIEKMIKNDIKKIDILINGNNRYINTANEQIDLFIKNNLKIIEDNKININVINCFEFSKNSDINQILKNHEYVLDTTGEKSIEDEEILYKQAN